MGCDGTTTSIFCWGKLMFFVFFLTAVGMQRERGCYPPLSESCVRMGSGFGVSAGAVGPGTQLSAPFIYSATLRGVGTQRGCACPFKRNI